MVSRVITSFTTNCVYTIRFMLKNLIVTSDIREKLIEKHQVKEGEVHECFFNKEGPYLEDTEEDHRTEPPTERVRVFLQSR